MMPSVRRRAYGRTYANNRLSCGENTDATLQAPLRITTGTLFGELRCVKFVGREESDDWRGRRRPGTCGWMRVNRKSGAEAPHSIRIAGLRERLEARRVGRAEQAPPPRSRDKEVIFRCRGGPLLWSSRVWRGHR